MEQINNDQYGRQVQFDTDGTIDTYIVSDPISNTQFTVQVPAGKPRESIYSTINAMAPSGS